MLVIEETAEVDVGRGGVWELSTFHSIFYKLKTALKVRAIFKNTESALWVKYNTSAASSYEFVTSDLIQHPHFTERKTEALPISKTK